MQSNRSNNLSLTILATGLFFGFLCPIKVQAEEIKVYSNEFVVAPPKSGAIASSLSAVSNDLGLQVVNNLAGGAALVRLPSLVGSLNGPSDGAEVSFDESDSICKLIRKRGLECSQNFVMRALALPNDPQMGELWGLNSTQGIDATRAWNRTTGGSNVVVAVIDTGIDYTHPDLAGNVWTNPGEIAGNGQDDDQNGYIDDVHGINVLNNSGNPYDDNEHGTHVAGTIGAATNNARGVAGVSWQVKLMGLKFLSANGSGSLAGAVQAINYMVMMKNRGVNIRVSNNSWGGGGYSRVLHDAIARARDAGIIFVAAAGNESNDNDANPSYPANYDLENVVSVAAVDINRNVANFSNYGASSVDIAAPGVNILSTTPGNTYKRFSGTSMATPHVSGALALLQASAPELNVNEMIERLYTSGVSVRTLDGIVRTGRMLNVARLVYGETSPLPIPTPIPNCSYSSQEINYNPDLSADNNPIVLQVDENQSYALALPFEFPFYGSNTNSLSVSPNGVIYTRAAMPLDYENDRIAPLNSIAALHTDLYARSNPHGVRVATSSDKVTISYLVKHYAARNGGDVEVRSSLYADGRIDVFVDFADSDIAELVASQATIGVTGSASSRSTTFAHNSSKIRSQLGVRFTPHCNSSSDGANVQRLALKGLSAKNQKTEVAVHGGRVLIQVRGSGTGSINITPAFNGRACGSAIPVSLIDGRAALTGRLPRDQRLQRFGSSTGNRRDSIAVTSGSSARRARLGRLSSTRLEALCERFAVQVRSR